MSRDFTPRQSLIVEEATGISLWGFMEHTTLSYAGKETPLYDPSEVVLRKSYPLLGKLLSRFSYLYKALANIDGGLDFLRNKDIELARYVKSGDGNLESYLIKWFEGTLDPNFYYSERNEEMFIENLIKEAKKEKNKNE